MAELFSEIASLLEPYYVLVQRVNAMHELTIKDFSLFCSPSLAKEIIQLQKLYDLSGKMRSCGNPSFVHSLRSFIWAQALGFSKKTSRIVLAHDVVEDFGKTYEQICAMLTKIPKDIRPAIKLLTNQYKVIAKEMAPYKTIGSIKKKLVSFYYEDDMVPQKIFTLLGNLPEGLSPNTYLQENAYRFYIEDIVESSDEELLSAKFIDRLDNTLTDLPSKFDVILKLYDKNLLLLTLSKDIVARTKYARLQLLYLLLFERFMDQSKALRRRYDYIAKVRGKFYGKQYFKLSRDLRSYHKELEKLAPFAERLYKLKQVQRLVITLRNHA